MHFKNPLEDRFLQDVLNESIRESQAEIVFSTEKLKQILHKDRIFLYGAGGLGQKVLQLLLQLGYQREKISFVVTNAEKSINGFTVRSIDDLQNFDSQKDVLVLTVTKRWEREIISMLDMRCLPYVRLEEGYAIMSVPNYE